MFVCSLCGEVDESQVFNIKERFGDKYQIGKEAGESESSTCPWHTAILCRNGHITPNGKSTLWVCAENKSASTRLRNMAEQDQRIELVQDGDDGVSVVVLADDFGLIVPVMKPLAKGKK